MNMNTNNDFTTDGYFTIPTSNGIRIMNNDNHTILFSHDYNETSVNACLQDNTRTIKIFKDEPIQPLAPSLPVNGHDYKKTSRITFIDGGILFEKYDLYTNGCNITIENGIIIIRPLTTNR